MFWAKKVIEESKIGDKIFCLEEMFEEVTLLSKPNDPFGNCEYETKEGDIKTAFVGLFRPLSKGKYYHEIDVERAFDADKDEDLMILMVKRVSMEAGFRVEISDGGKIRVFGDTQKEVDDFVNLSIYNKRVLSP